MANINSGWHGHPLKTTESWLLLASLGNLGSSAASPISTDVCRRDWARCICHCNSVPVLEKVLSAAFQDARSEVREVRQCQQQLITKSLDPNSSDASACQLLQQCLLQGPLSSILPSAKKLLKCIEECILDLCCTSVRGAQGLLALRQRETTVYTTLLGSHHGFVADLARFLTGHSSDAGLQVLPDSSKLTMLIDTCYKSQQATSESQLKVVHLMSACAVADPGLYSMLLSDLEQITWQGKDPGHQRAAAAGILDGLFCHLESLTLDLWHHIMDMMQQLLESQHGKVAGLQLAAVVAIGRLLMHASDVCSDLGQTEQLVALLVQCYVQPDSSDRGRIWPAQSSQQTNGTQHALGFYNDSQQALHLFFQEHSKHHADELANTCVLLICDAISKSLLLWDSASGLLHYQQDFGLLQEGSTVRLQCKFLAKLVQQTELPMQAVYDAACVNVSAMDMQPDAIRQWLQ